MGVPIPVYKEKEGEYKEIKEPKERNTYARIPTSRGTITISEAVVVTTVHLSSSVVSDGDIVEVGSAHGVKSRVDETNGGLTVV